VFGFSLEPDGTVVVDVIGMVVSLPPEESPPEIRDKTVWS
jgi:hypothetical protein